VHRTIPPGVSGYKSDGVEHAARRFRGLPENICISAVSTLVRSESDSLFLCYSNPEKARKPAFRLINPTATPFEREQRPDPAILPKKQTPATARLLVAASLYKCLGTWPEAGPRVGFPDRWSLVENCGHQPDFGAQDHRILLQSGARKETIPRVAVKAMRRWPMSSRALAAPPHDTATRPITHSASSS
jgi:hypothetical protein